MLRSIFIIPSNISAGAGPTIICTSDQLSAKRSLRHNRITLHYIHAELLSSVLRSHYTTRGLGGITAMMVRVEHASIAPKKGDRPCQLARKVDPSFTPARNAALSSSRVFPPQRRHSHSTEYIKPQPISPVFLNFTDSALIREKKSFSEVE